MPVVPIIHLLLDPLVLFFQVTCSLPDDPESRPDRSWGGYRLVCHIQNGGTLTSPLYYVSSKYYALVQSHPRKITA